MAFEESSRLSFRDLSRLQTLFAEQYVRGQRDVLAVRVRRDCSPPILDVKHAYGADPAQLGLPASFEGVAVRARSGAPAVVAV